MISENMITENKGKSQMIWTSIHLNNQINVEYINDQNWNVQHLPHPHSSDIIHGGQLHHKCVILKIN